MGQEWVSGWVGGREGGGDTRCVGSLLVYNITAVVYNSSLRHYEYTCSETLYSYIRKQFLIIIINIG